MSAPSPVVAASPRVEVGDLDGDGDAEVALPCRYGAHVWRGPLTGLWLTSDADVSYNMPQFWASKVPHHAGDYDGDGLFHLVIDVREAGAWLAPWPL